MTQAEFLDAIRDLLKEYGGYTLEGPDWAGDVILRRQLDGEESAAKVPAILPPLYVKSWAKTGRTTRRPVFSKHPFTLQ